MKLDNENQRRVLLQLIAASTFPGNFLNEAFELKRAIETAEIEPSTEPEPESR